MKSEPFGFSIKPEPSLPPPPDDVLLPEPAASPDPIGKKMAEAALKTIGLPVTDENVAQLLNK